MVDRQQQLEIAIRDYITAPRSVGSVINSIRTIVHERHEDQSEIREDKEQARIWRRLQLVLYQAMRAADRVCDTSADPKPDDQDLIGRAMKCFSRCRNRAPECPIAEASSIEWFGDDVALITLASSSDDQLAVYKYQSSRLRRSC